VKRSSEKAWGSVVEVGQLSVEDEGQGGEWATRGWEDSENNTLQPKRKRRGKKLQQIVYREGKGRPRLNYRG